MSAVLWWILGTIILSLIITTAIITNDYINGRLIIDEGYWESMDYAPKTGMLIIGNYPQGDIKIYFCDNHWRRAEPIGQIIEPPDGWRYSIKKGGALRV